MELSRKKKPKQLKANKNQSRAVLIVQEYRNPSGTNRLKKYLEMHFCAGT